MGARYVGGYMYHAHMICTILFCCYIQVKSRAVRGLRLSTCPDHPSMVDFGVPFCLQKVVPQGWSSPCLNHSLLLDPVEKSAELAVANYVYVYIYIYIHIIHNIYIYIYMYIYIYIYILLLLLIIIIIGSLR